MTYRTHAAHTTCPGCQEEVYLDELVKGRCPLCGCSLEDMDGLENEVDEFVDRNDFSWLVFNYFIFKTFTELGASPLKVMELLALYETGCLRVGQSQRDTKFELDLPAGRFDFILPHRCDKCGRIFLGGGKRVISGDLSLPGYRIVHRCRSCQ